MRGKMRSQNTPDIERRRTLRREATEPERVLWSHLRARRLEGSKFRRQVPVGPFIVDFFNKQARLAVEVDGNQHAEQLEYDDRRTAWLNDQGVHVLRFTTPEIIGKISSVLDSIDAACRERTP
jgi:very-short-patch-repair endonuclease